MPRPPGARAQVGFRGRFRILNEQWVNSLACGFGDVQTSFRLRVPRRSQRQALPSLHTGREVAGCMSVWNVG